MVLEFLKASFQKVKGALTKTHHLLRDKIQKAFGGELDEKVIEKLEGILYEADFGVQTAHEMTSYLKDAFKKDPSLTSEDLIKILEKHILEALQKRKSHFLEKIGEHQPPFVILVVGVNGNGKTTACAKLAKLFKEQGKKVLLGASDTFRAAAIDQLDIWARRLDIDIVKGQPKTDPAAIAFDALSASMARGVDVLIIDTAGRLHTKTPLMQELEKIKRTLKKLSPTSPHETLLVLDATTGQNAIDQAKIFNQHVPISGLVLTKLDGTSKGGIAFSLVKNLGIPITFIGVGEGENDLLVFDPDQYVRAIFE